MSAKKSLKPKLSPQQIAEQNRRDMPVFATPTRVANGNAKRAPAGYDWPWLRTPPRG